MISIENIAEELFNKIRGRFPDITIGDENSTITNDPKEARYFDFEYKPGQKVHVSLDEKAVTVMYSNKLFDTNETSAKNNWYDFLKELRTFSKKRMLNFDTRDITKSNLDKRDYEYLTKNRAEENTMSESKMYGTSRTSFQDIGSARLVVKHTGPVNQDLAAGRTQQIHSIYVESSEGERYKYPYIHLNGARALARHVSEGGNLYDDFGQHIVTLSEELSKLRKFKTYMNRSNVMAEGLAGYLDVVNERIETVKKNLYTIQKQTGYAEYNESFEKVNLEEVPEDIQTDWVEQLTIKQFNEELKSVFPYIYKLVSEANAVQELGPQDILGTTEASGYEGSNDARAHKISIDGDFDPEKPVNQNDCEGIEDALQQAGIESSCEPDESNFEGVIIHTMADKVTVVKALVSAGIGVTGTDENIEPETNFESSLDDIISNAKFMQDTQEEEEDTTEGNEFAQKVRVLKAKGAKPGTKFKTSDGEEHTLEDAIKAAGLDITEFWSEDELEADADTMDVKIDKDGAMSKADAEDEEQKTPLDEFIKSYYDYTTNNFPKGETAVLTAVQKQYGDEALEQAQSHMAQLLQGQDDEMAQMRKLAGV